ncbi:MAG TPA: M28 family peptidase [Actinomycetes bacterium]
MTPVTRFAAGALVAVLAGCTTAERTPRADTSPKSSTSPTPPTSPTPSGPRPTTTSTEPTSTEPTSSGLPGFDAAAAMTRVRRIAALGPREATSPAFRQASRLVARELAGLGYDVRRQKFPVPAGESWGVPVPAGRTVNLVARLPGAPAAGQVVVGAHLDTVPQAPGAEDNASGVAVLLELARLARLGTRHPVTFVVFGAEEPRGPGDDEHHFGAQAYLRRATRQATDVVQAMVSLDRVGAPGRVPVCTGGLSPLRLRRQLLGAAERIDVPARACENRTSDHWPFEKAGETVARVGGNPYPAYHSARDRPRVVSRRQLDRVGRMVWEWLRAA